MHADTPTLLRNRQQRRCRADCHLQATHESPRFGRAECVGVTSIAGHFCIDALKAISPLPVVDMISEVSREIETRGLKRIGITGTRNGDGDPLLWGHYQCRDHPAKRA